MAPVPKSRCTPAEYLQRERAAEFRSEFYNGDIFAMSGGSRQHSIIAMNLARHLGNALADRRCQPFNSDMRVKVSDTGLYTYPDLSIVCDRQVFEDAEVDTLLNPTVIIEVLSKSTESYDRGKKFSHYRRIDTLREYILVSQTEPMVERFVRQDDDKWLLQDSRGMESALEIEVAGVTLRLADIYDGVEFAPEADSDGRTSQR
ncbi:MAG: Uma2 family endonuclease [Planctomycetota bacterium]